LKNIKIINDILSPIDLLDRLEELNNIKSSYIFRGQPNKEFILQPKAFRKDIIRKLSDDYPNKTLQEWGNREKVREFVKNWFLDEGYINHPCIRRLIEIDLYIMKYNYFLAKYIEQNPHKVDPNTAKMYLERGASFWTTEKTFKYLFSNEIGLLVGVISLDGRILKESYINEDFSGYDEYLPQHYDTPTVALDWSKNPHIAIFFAIREIPPDATHFSIYAYKQINSEKTNPIEIKEGLPNPNNLRIKHQEGLFTRFRYACLYYLLRGTWPCIEIYDPLSLSNFELIRFDVPRSYDEDLKRFLIRQGLTKEFLLPG